MEEGEDRLARDEEFAEIYRRNYPKAVSVLEAGIGDAFTYLRYLGSHHARIHSMNMLERGSSRR